MIEALPRANYELLIEMRYRWYNNRESGHALVRNPPAATEQQCAAENTDQYPGNPPNGDGIDADEDADTTRPACAFYIEPGETRYSNWAEVRVSVTGPLTGVPDVSMEIDPYTGLVAATADLLLVAWAVEPDGIGPLAHTLTVFAWLILATVVAAGSLRGHRNEDRQRIPGHLPVAGHLGWTGAVHVAHDFRGRWPTCPWPACYWWAGPWR